MSALVHVVLAGHRPTAGWQGYHRSPSGSFGARNLKGGKEAALIQSSSPHAYGHTTAQALPYACARVARTAALRPCTSQHEQSGYGFPCGVSSSQWHAWGWLSCVAQLSVSTRVPCTGRPQPQWPACLPCAKQMKTRPAFTPQSPHTLRPTALHCSCSGCVPLATMVAGTGYRS